jgi:hypothetical protein
VLGEYLTPGKGLSQKPDQNQKNKLKAYYAATIMRAVFVAFVPGNINA